SDKDKRGAYDRGEIDADGNPRFAGFSRGGAGARPGGAAGAGFSAEDILKEFMSGFGGQPRGQARGGKAGWDPFTGGMGGNAGGFSQGRSQSLKGDDVNLTATVTLEEAN